MSLLQTLSLAYGISIVLTVAWLLRAPRLSDQQVALMDRNDRESDGEFPSAHDREVALQLAR